MGAVTCMVVLCFIEVYLLIFEWIHKWFIILPIYGSLW